MVAVVRFPLGGAGQVSYSLPATEHILNNSHDFVTAIVISYITASHTQGRVPWAAPGSGNQKRKKGS